MVHSSSNRPSIWFNRTMRSSEILGGFFFPCWVFGSFLSPTMSFYLKREKPGTLTVTMKFAYFGRVIGRDVDWLDNVHFSAFE